MVKPLVQDENHHDLNLKDMKGLMEKYPNIGGLLSLDHIYVYK
ncbi:MAG: hypothetical protein ACW98K_11380 [Candidatus Kariarchaeaceae archaeon]|jgi:hypothetical protein